MPAIAFPAPPNMLGDEKEHRRLIAECLGGAMQGKLNAVATLTLTPSATSTVLRDIRIGPATWIGLMPITASAATAAAAVWYDTTTVQKVEFAPQITIRHASNAAADQTFRVLLIG